MSFSVLIIAHAPLASALKECALHVFSCDQRLAESIIPYDITAETDVSDLIEQLSQRHFSSDSDTLILSDIVGATPGNIAKKLSEHPSTALIYGVNLPMVLTALCHSECSFEDIVKQVRNSGINGIN